LFEEVNHTLDEMLEAFHNDRARHTKLSVQRIRCAGGGKQFEASSNLLVRMASHLPGCIFLLLEVVIVLSNSICYTAKQPR
jgi:hypothetical protein